MQSFIEESHKVMGRVKQVGIVLAALILVGLIFYGTRPPKNPEKNDQVLLFEEQEKWFITYVAKDSEGNTGFESIVVTLPPGGAMATDVADRLHQQVGEGVEIQVLGMFPAKLQ